MLKGAANVFGKHRILFLSIKDRPLKIEECKRQAPHDERALSSVSFSFSFSWGKW